MHKRYWNAALKLRLLILAKRCVGTDESGSGDSKVKPEPGSEHESVKNARSSGGSKVQSELKPEKTESEGQREEEEPFFCLVLTTHDVFAEAE